MAGEASVAMVLLVLLVFQRYLPCQGQGCKYTPHPQDRYRLNIALLASSHTNFEAQKVVQENILLTGDLMDCVLPIQWIYLYVNESLHLERDGWCGVQEGIRQAVIGAAVLGSHNPHIVIGPFYSNLAMMLEKMEVAYLITEDKGYTWIDKCRVTDPIPWKTLIEIPPPAQQLNQAVVDLFKSERWPSAILMMPANAADNQECQDLMSQLLDSRVSLVPFTLNPTSSALKKDIHDIVRNAHLVRQNQFVVCSPRDPRDKLIEQILEQARNLAVLDDKDVTFIFVDPTSSLTPFYGATEMHALGLLSAEAQILAFRYSLPQDEESALKGTAVATDAGRVVTLGLHKYLLSREQGRENKFNTLDFVEAMKKVKVNGSTGYISFNERGQRSNYTLELYNHGGSELYKKMANWRPGGASIEDRLNITDVEEMDNIRPYGLFPDVVRIVVVMEFPFVMKRIFLDGMVKTNKNQYEGFTIDLINELARELGFDFEIYESPRNSYGGLNVDGTWDGMVGEVMSGNATLACGAISINSARESVIDFSLGVLSTGVNILIHKPAESYNIIQFMKPFSLKLWVAILGALTLVSSVYYVLDYFNKEERKFTFKETVWFTIGTMLKRGSDFVPAPVSQRILTIGFSFFVIITVSSYTANMAAFLTTKKYDQTVDSFESLAASRMNVYTVKHSATSAFFERGTKDVYKSLWNRMRRGGLVSDASAGVEKVVDNRGAAFVFDYLINEGAQNRNCSTMATGSPILLQEHGIGMSPGAPFKTRINIAILKLKESGFLARLRKKWWDDKRECQLGKGKVTADKAQFGVRHTLGVFIVSVFGVSVSAILFISKKVGFAITARFRRYQARNKQRHNNHAQSDTIIGNDTGTPV